MINRWSTFSNDGTYRAEDGDYTMYTLVCSLDARRSALERLKRIGARVEKPIHAAEGKVFIDYCKKAEEQNA